MTAQNGDRVIFERLATPRPAIKVTLKRNRQSQRQQHEQQPQQPISHTDVPSLWKQRAAWGKTRQKCKTTRNTSQKRTRYLESGCNPVLKWMWVIKISDKEVSTDAFLKNEAVKEELTDTNTRAIERTKLGSNNFGFVKIWRWRRWCLAKNPTKLFSKWVLWSS